jgi:hypothetical protein
MADNVTITPGTGETISTEEVTSLNGATVPAQQVQRIAPTLVTGNGTAVDVAESNPLPTQEVSSATGLLNRILAVLLSPMGYDRSIGRSRTTTVLESGTVTTVTTVSTVSTVTTCSTVNTVGTVTTVSGLTNIDGRNGSMLINQSNLSAWADCVRARIT